MSLYAGLLLSLICLPWPAARDTNNVVSHSQNDCTINFRDFLLPINCEADRKEEVKTVIFHVSTDRGRTWRKAGEVSPDDDGLPFHAKEDGEYWFTLQVADKDGKKWPTKVTATGAQVMKVSVDTRKQVASAKMSDPANYKMPYAD
jgi:hypothetical protein